jgi:hypothetical protein
MGVNVGKVDGVELKWYMYINTTQTIIVSTRGPLHTRAKSRDHEIVRAQSKVSKGRPNIPPKSCSVVTDLQV